MTVRQLRQILFEVRDQDAEIRFASQPRWPFEYSFSGPVEVEDEEGVTTVYLVEERQLGYLPGDVKDEIGW